MNLKYYRNIPLLYIYSVLIKRVSMPIIILYFLLNNLNFTQIGILAAVMAITQISLEIPGGIFADTHGKKLSLMLHSVFATLTMFFYFIGNSFVYFLIASVMYGIAGGFITGTRNALLYDSLTELNKASEFKKYNGRVLLYSHLINAGILLMIPVIYNYNSKLPFLIGITFFIISIVTSLFMIEPPIQKIHKKSFSSYYKRFFESLKEISVSKKLLLTLILSMIAAGFVYMSSEFIQPLLRISGLEIIYFGIIYALMRGITGLGGIVTHKIEKYFKLDYLLFIGAGIILISFVGFSYGVGLIIILAVLLIKFGEGFNRIVFEDEINKNIKSNNRTTILSVSSLSNSLLKALLIVIFGIVADIVGVQGMFIYVIILFLIVVALVLFFMRINIHKSKNIKYYKEIK